MSEQHEILSEGDVGASVMDPDADPPIDSATKWRILDESRESEPPIVDLTSGLAQGPSLFDEPSATVDGVEEVRAPLERRDNADAHALEVLRERRLLWHEHPRPSLGPREALAQAVSPPAARRLASGRHLSLQMRLEPTGLQPARVHDYETVGYVIAGRARLYLDNSQRELNPGDSWVVPAGARHRYSVLEPLTALEAVHRRGR